MIARPDVTGGLALAQATEAAYLVNGEDEVSFDRTRIADGEVIGVGDRMRVRAIATPGHPLTHLSYALSVDGPNGEEPYAVFTGGPLLYGASGRPDLLGEENTDATTSTIGEEKRSKPGPDAGRGDLRPRAAGRSRVPGRRTTCRWNPPTPPGRPRPTFPVQVAPSTEQRRPIEAGAWVVDLRNRKALGSRSDPVRDPLAGQDDAERVSRPESHRPGGRRCPGLRLDP